MLPWAHTSPQPKQHLDRFSHFAGLTTATDRQTDHAAPSVTIGRIYVVRESMRRNYLVKISIVLRIRYGLEQWSVYK